MNTLPFYRCAAHLSTYAGHNKKRPIRDGTAAKSETFDYIKRGKIAVKVAKTKKITASHLVKRESIASSVLP